MSTKLNFKKRKICLSILLCAVIIFAGTATHTAKAQTYDPYAVQVINNLIANNGLQAIPDAPETWEFATWNDEMPKQILELDLSLKNLKGFASFAELTTLERLICINNTNITEIDVTNCISLKRLACYGNKLTKLDITSCKKLERLSFGRNLLTELDVTHSERWTILNGNYNCLTGLDLSKFGFITEFEVDDQNVSLTLHENETGNYTYPILLNNPSFSNSVISYTEGLLTSTDASVDNSDFEVMVGTSLANKLRGTMHFNYIPLSIKTPENIQSGVYPNPVKDIFYIEFETFNHVILYDMQGKAVLNQIANNKTGISISHLPKGVYIVNAISEYKIIGQTKIVKQ